MVTYDKHYNRKNYFGHPCPELIKFFKTHQLNGKILDLGCGQGRDTLAIARLGYSVVGVDLSKVGINQMIATAEKENLDVKGILGDINSFTSTNNFDTTFLQKKLREGAKSVKKSNERS